MEAASSAPRSQVSDRIYFVLSTPETCIAGNDDDGNRSNPYAMPGGGLLPSAAVTQAMTRLIYP
jgi:hypothetical protein